MPDLVSEAAGLGAELWANSIARSLLQGDPFTTEHHFDPGYIKLWWGPIVPVRPGYHITYFRTPYGIAVESVTAPGGKLELIEVA